MFNARGKLLYAFPYGQSPTDNLFQSPHKINHFENDAVSS